MESDYAECRICKYQFHKPDVDDTGIRIKCPSCGGLARNYYVSLSGTVYAVGSVEATLTVASEPNPEIEAVFKLDDKFAGKSIIEYSNIVDEKLIDYFSAHPQELKTMNRRGFEDLVAELFHGFGYDVELTKQTRDGGRDIIVVRNSEVKVKYLIECKRPDPGKKVGVQPVRELFGVKNDELATKAILATTAYFSRDAKLFYEKHEWELELRDYNDLIEWIRIYLNMKGRG
ncbi:MAG: restriction endonuclease [Ignavibacteriales bacterium]|nr:restriction endonuclease [Ignavibacteriales bacterium]